MRNWKALWFLVGVGTSGYGCAAPVAGDEAAGLDAQAEALSASDNLLALGDSIAFGYNPFGDFTKDKNFVGYPDVLKDDHEVAGLKNSSCPGESSGSFLSTSAPDNGCRNYRGAYPLHVNYGANATQMDYALSRITSAEPEDVPTTITLNIGGNDIFLLQRACATDPRGPAVCFQAGAPALIGQIATNVATILTRIRVQGGYQGAIVYQNLYSVDYTNPATLGFLAALNNTVSNVARQFGATVADAFSAFGAASAQAGGSACAAGLLIPLPSGGCDVHPSALGASILADTVINAQ